MLSGVSGCGVCILWRVMLQVWHAVGLCVLLLRRVYSCCVVCTPAASCVLLLRLVYSCCVVCTPAASCVLLLRCVYSCCVVCTPAASCVSIHTVQAMTSPSCSAWSADVAWQLSLSCAVAAAVCANQDAYAGHLERAVRLSPWHQHTIPCNKGFCCSDGFD
jgi:hypothetical protein